MQLKHLGVDGGLAGAGDPDDVVQTRKHSQQHDWLVLVALDLWNPVNEARVTHALCGLHSYKHRSLPLGVTVSKQSKEICAE